MGFQRLPAKCPSKRSWASIKRCCGVTGEPQSLEPPVHVGIDEKGTKRTTKDKVNITSNNGTKIIHYKYFLLGSFFYCRSNSRHSICFLCFCCSFSHRSRPRGFDFWTVGFQLGKLIFAGSSSYYLGRIHPRIIWAPNSLNPEGWLGNAPEKG